MENNSEEWKDVVGFEGLYQVSNKGRIKSLPRVRNCKGGHNYLTKEHILSDGYGGKDYHYVSLKKGNIYHTVYVHRLVAEAFIFNPENKPWVLHKNDIKTDNRVENLYWGINYENHLDMAKNHVYNAKLTRDNVIEIRKLLSEGKRSIDIAKIFNIGQSVISHIKYNRTHRVENYV